ncbi:MAG: sodium:proton antiporter [Bacteroidales bacterium]|nr:sodium:proton antiporter [Bacteroidales bacterium]
MTNSSPSPSLTVALLPLLALIGLISLTISIYGSDALAGGCQTALLISTGLCICLSMSIYHIKWQVFEDSIKETVSGATVSIVILLVIGMMSGAWMICGTVPTLIYYGIQIMSPKFFLISTCILCALVSVATGSSWTTIATIGVALIGIGKALGAPVEWTAGAIISGAYFGDKISPLSDTTTLAASVTGTDLFRHIRYMMGTTVPTMTISCAIYLIAGFYVCGEGELHISEYTEGLARTFNITPLTLVVPLVTGVLIYKKVPSLITLSASAITGIIMAVFLQGDILKCIAGDDISGLLAYVKGAMTTLFTSTHVATGSEALDALVETGGMGGMMDTIWLILCAMCFGGAMIGSGMLTSITTEIIKHTKGIYSLVSATSLSGIIMNLTTCDQYISIIIEGNMFKDVYREKGYESCLLSRTTEDSATVTSVLIPWSTCGMTQSTVLNVATMAYMPFCFFNFLSPIMTIICAGRAKRQFEKKNVSM